jgi:cephalosporin hydroxylase
MLEVDKSLASQVVLKLVEIVGYRPYPLDELFLMAAAFQYHQPEVVIDIGTHVGKSARIWFELSRRLHTETTIHTVDSCDPNHPEYPGDTLGKFIRGTTVKQHIEDGYACACALVAKNPTASFLVFLDSDHTYENVRRELELARIVGRGCLLVHDTFYQPGSGYNHGPYLAIQDSVRDWPIKQVFHLQTGLPGMSYLGLD